MKRRTPTQVERVGRALERYGRVSQLDFDLPNTIDGLPPIRRVASRIADLRAAGWRIDGRERRHGMAVYRLLSKQPPATPDPAPSAQPELLAPEVGARRPAGPYDDLETAA